MVQSGEISPQEGFQLDFLECGADIAIGGGVAGAGKSFALILEPLFHVQRRGFNAVYFRRTTPEILAPGALWEESQAIYQRPQFRGIPNKSRLEWRFPTKSKIKFSHLEREDDKLKHKGAQYALICFDELTSFTETQFWYLVSRNRTTCGISAYVRATTNPQRNGWVKRLISWWLYPDNHPDKFLRGKPIPERAGVIRYLYRIKGRHIWGDTVQDIIDQVPDEFPPDDLVPPRNKIKSVTFIPGKLSDNQELLKADPGYVGNLLALPEMQKAMLYDGSWRFVPDDDILYNPDAVEEIFSNTWIKGTQKYISADIAFDGSDRFVVMVWEGWKMIDLSIYPRSSGPEIVNIIERKRKQFGVPQNHIVYDSDGGGQFLKGYLKRAVNFVNNGKPIPVEGERENYRYIKDQLYFKLRTIFDEYKIWLDIPEYMQVGDDVINIHQEIKDELMAIRDGGRDKEGKLFILPKKEIKKELGRSPDLADTIMERMIFDLIKPKRGRTSTF